MEIIESPWKRWGKHRTYLNGADGTRMGFYDHQTGELTVEVDAVRAELQAWVAQNATNCPTADPTPVIVEAEGPVVASAPTQRSPRHALGPAVSSMPDPLPSLYRVPGALAFARAATLPAEQAEPWIWAPPVSRPSPRR